MTSERETITLAHHEDRPMFEPGDHLVFQDWPRWYVRLWRWFKRVVLRRKRPVVVVTHIDREKGIITLDSLVLGERRSGKTSQPGRVFPMFRIGDDQ